MPSGDSTEDPGSLRPSVDLDPVLRLTEDTLREHGVSAAGAGWSSAETQALRFEMLAQAVGLDRETPVTVNDLGCGYGALHGYLADHGFDVTEYHGYDISADMLAAARTHVSCASPDFVRSPYVIKAADVSLLSGPLNYKSCDDAAWKLYARSVIVNLAAHSRHGFAFNMMTTRVTYRVAHLYYADPDEWVDWCRREIDADFTLLHDYPLYEWTIGGRFSRGEAAASHR